MDKCKHCGKPIPFFSGEVCQECADKKRTEFENNEKKVVEDFSNMPIVTVPEIAGRKIVKYYNIISSEVVIGTGIFSEVSASIDDLFGMTSNAFEKKLSKAKTYAINRLKHQAVSLGANAIIGAKTDYLVTTNNMFMFAVSGTPVILDENINKDRC